MKEKEPFYWRAFVTFLVVLSFSLLAVSGLVLFIAPPGRIANWSKWSIGALTKANWQAVHTVFALLFVVLGGFHLYFNWRVVLNYIRAKLGGGVRRGRELALASGLGVVVLASTVAGLAPFSTVMTFGEEVKNSWSTPANEPPVPHAEAWTLAKFAENAKVPVERVVENLAKHGVQVASNDVTLQAIARERQVTPKEVYDWALAGLETSARQASTSAGGSPFMEGGGWGRRTVQQICEQLGIGVDQGLERLRAAGFAGATATSNLRELAQSQGRTPIEVATVIRGQ